MITRQQAERDYKLFKNQAISSYNNKEIKATLLNIQIACKIAYQINFKYSDFEFENLLALISIAIVKI